MQQGTDEWFAARVGKVTASKLNDVLAMIKTGEAATRRNYRAQLVAERLTGKKSDSFTNSAMQWGTETEPLARSAYEVKRGVFVEEVGFIDHPTIKMSGASPDGVISDDGLVEIKCPNTATHIDYLLSGNPPNEYHNQMLWQMECTGRQWCDFVSFDPRLPEELQLFVVRFGRDEARLSELREAVSKFNAEVDATVTSLLAIFQKKEQS